MGDVDMKKEWRTMINEEKRPVVFSDEGPTKLKVPPKACELCGKPFIPSGGNSKYCPRCRELSTKKRNKSLFSKHATMAFGYGPWSEDYEAVKDELPIANLIADMAQVANLLYEIEKTYAEGFGIEVITIRCSYEFRTNYDELELVPFVQVKAEDFFKMFEHKNFEYRHGKTLTTVRRWEGRTLFEAVIH